MINSVTVTISDGTSDSDGDDEWGDGKEVVVLDRTAGAASFGAHPSVTGMDVVGDDPGEGQLGSLGGGNRALLVASLANLAISYNVVSGGVRHLVIFSMVPSVLGLPLVQVVYFIR